MIHTSGCIVVVETTISGGMRSEIFESREEMFEAFINDGRIGDGMWGSVAHETALRRISQYSRKLAADMRRTRLLNE